MAEFGFTEGSFNPVAATEDNRSFGELTAGLAPPMPVQADATPPVGFDEANNRVFVNGFEFDADDHDSALRSKEAFLNPVVPMPTNYRSVDAEEFGGYIKRISDPSIGRIIKKNFGIGVDNLQLLAGRGLQFAGAEETGQKIVDQQIEDLRFTQPYQRLFTDIDSAGGAVEWFVANLAQQGPMLIESALSAIAGGIVGGLVGGGPNPFTAIGGAFLALSGKAKVRQEILKAAAKYSRKETLNKTEEKLLREAASGAVARELKINAKKISPTILSKEGVIKDFLGEAGLVRGGAEALKRGKLQARIGGAIIGRYVNSLGIGVSDIYGEQIESGTENRGAAFGLAIPYALAESIPELLGLGFFIRGGKSLVTGVSKAGRRAKFKAAGVRALKRTGRAAAGGAIAAFGEGTTEALQEALLLSQNPEVDAGSAEGINRLINSFAAGAGVGGAIGTVGGAVRRHNLEEDNADILKPVPPPPITPPGQGVQQELFPDDDLGAGPIPTIEDSIYGTREQDDQRIEGERAAARAQDEFGTSLEGTLLDENASPERIAETQRLQREALNAEREGSPTILDPNQGELFPEEGAAPAPPAAPAAPVAPAPAPAPIASTAQPVPVDFPPGASPQETQDFLAAQEATPNAALAAPLQAAADQGRAQRVAAERDAAVQQQRQQQFDEAASARQTQELDQALEGSVAPVLGEQLELGALPQGAPRQTGIAPPRFINGKEAIASPTDGIFTPVRELIEKAQQNFEALRQLETCLGKG